LPTLVTLRTTSPSEHTAPAAITTPTLPGHTGLSLTLRSTAPGDDGAGNGSVSGYRFKLNATPFTTFARTANVVNGVALSLKRYPETEPFPAPSSPGAVERRVNDRPVCPGRVGVVMAAGAVCSLGDVVRRVTRVGS